ncbi:MAG TPA: hypothetical protein VF739_11985 [Ktedonobacterales bacterium]
MPDTNTPPHEPLIQVIVIGQEGDDKEVTINPNEPCAQLLRAGLHALYGDPGPNPDEYNLVFGGTPIAPLTQTIASVGITNGAEVSIQPKQISRGSR